MANILIQPLIRMFGWSASDLSQYGTQPSSEVVDAPAHEGGLATHVSPLSDTTVSQSHHKTAAPTSHLVQDVYYASATPTAVALSHETAPTPVIIASPAVSAGAGAPSVASFGSTPAFDPRTAVVSHHADVTPPLAPTDAAAQAPASPITDLTTGTTTLAVETALHAVANTTQVVAPVVAGAVAVIATPLAHLGALTAPVLGVVTPVVADLGHVTAPLADVTDTLTPPALDTATAVAHLTAPLGDTPATLVNGTQDVVAHAADAIGTAVSVQLSTSGDVNEHFAGTDPAGGIQTLVTMVDSTDAFHIGPADAAAAPVAAIVDTLAGDDLAPALLGIGIDHHDIHHDALDAHGILGSL